MSATVLFTCAGQRVDIVSAFARAGATTVAADLNPLATDALLAPPSTLPAEFRALTDEGRPSVVTSAAVHFYISQSDKGELVMGGDIDGYNSYAQRGNLPALEHVAERSGSLLDHRAIRLGREVLVDLHEVEARSRLGAHCGARPSRALDDDHVRGRVAGSRELRARGDEARAEPLAARA